ncbi:MAG TPA: efflux RND transporter periplasmic adaptor subunit, partial [Candidatus Sulfotelmatobacter sp.]|nr:efflux RND transporter periplasmic adaptor subunit [Candidatus Sulfotelmatobacter sp.]
AGVPQRVPVIPPDAVIQEYGHAVVFVEHAPGQFERRVVALGPRNGASIPVLDGLRAADRIVVDGAILLKDQ